MYFRATLQNMYFSTDCQPVNISDISDVSCCVIDSPGAGATCGARSVESCKLVSPELITPVPDHSVGVLCSGDRGSHTMEDGASWHGDKIQRSCDNDNNAQHHFLTASYISLTQDKTPSCGNLRSYPESPDMSALRAAGKFSEYLIIYHSVNYHLFTFKP